MSGKGEKRNAYKGLVGKHEESRLLGNKPMWEDNIEKYLKYDGKAWTGFIWLRIGTSGGLL